MVDVAVRDGDVSEIEERDVERGRECEQQIRVSRIEEDLRAAILDEQGESWFAPELPVDQGRVLYQDRNPHSTPR